MAAVAVTLAAAAAEALAAVLAVAPFAPEFDDIAMNDGCCVDDVVVDDDNDGVNLKYLQQSQNFIVIACLVRLKSANQIKCTNSTKIHLQSE